MIDSRSQVDDLPFSRSALDIKSALEHVYLLKPIGYCPTMISALSERYHFEDEQEESIIDSHVSCTYISKLTLAASSL